MSRGYSEGMGMSNPWHLVAAATCTVIFILDFLDNDIGQILNVILRIITI